MTAVVKRRHNTEGFSKLKGSSSFVRPGEKEERRKGGPEERAEGSLLKQLSSFLGWWKRTV